jgi:protein arginine N-methyltransferase 2
MNAKMELHLLSLLSCLMAEMLHHILAGSSNEDIEDADGTITLRAEDKTSAGDNLTFLKSELRWETGEDGKERVMDADGNG